MNGTLFEAIEASLSGGPNKRLWSPAMETQLIFDEPREDGKGNRAIRVPHADGSYSDHSYFPDWAKLVAIGVSGWDYAEKVSCFFIFDVDSVANHKGGLTPEQLDALVAKLSTVPWVELVRSKSGHGYHARVCLAPDADTGRLPVAIDHDQHARHAQAVAQFLGIRDDVDACGRIGWIWHRDAAPNGWEVIHEATESLDFDTIPEMARPTSPPLAKEKEQVRLTAKHRELIAYCIGKGGIWDEAAKMLKTHTCVLADAHTALSLIGEFETISAGTDLATHNCFAFPLPKGAWRVNRYGKGTPEAETWRESPNGWTTCDLNKKKTKVYPTDLIYRQARAADEFYHDRSTAYAKVDNEFIPVGSEQYQQILRMRFEERYHNVPLTSWIHNVVDQLKAYAIQSGKAIKVYTRVAYVDGKLYIDTADERRHVVCIDKDGYGVVTNAPIAFRRSDKMLPLPLPQQGGTLDDLKQFINVHPNDWELFIGALLGMFLPEGAFVVLSFIGGDGRAKSSTLRYISALVDPSIVEGASDPKCVQDLILAASQRYLLTFDNLSGFMPGLGIKRGHHWLVRHADKGIDNAIRRIGTSYDDMGRVQYVASYSDTAGTTAVNQVEQKRTGKVNATKARIREEAEQP